MNRVSTYFALMAEYGEPVVTLATICEKYFGLSPVKASVRAGRHALPIPVWRGGSQKSTWLVSLEDLAEFIDRQRELAREEWQQVNA
ncbi:pyocin activator PrtN family protein [Marinobacter sp. DY40_1A1]|uniref:pyocin activator PrtN family protein n=1 Tax=Marinobacter sp. DY40_1A1 TaxID=2583229 RepID=UPI0019035575|nr:pyocin activator PrtN family protein [Marinobacter sp. DY40_1A1]MBK1885592.1 pyocin activator PrtN family protein [Marinobacter sp. DY40_1A1]